MMHLIGWALLLIIQAMSFTWVSRARNSGSILYHGVAAVFSNGIFFLSQFIMFVSFKDASLGRAVLLGIVYVIATVSGAVLMHWISLRYLEKGTRKVS